MKKLIALCAVGALAFAACGDDDDDTPATDPAVETEAAAEETDAVVDETDAAEETDAVADETDAPADTDAETTEATS